MRGQGIEITSAKFERLRPTAAPGRVMLVTVEGSNIENIGSPFRARIGDQPIRGLAIRSGGGLFQGFLDQLPRPGDRLYVGYDTADIETRFVYQPEPRQPLVG